MAKIQFADALRGVAAIVVMWWHYVGFWLGRDAAAAMGNFPPMPAGQPATPAIAIAFAQSAYGFVAVKFGVALFFLVSGFVIPFSFSSYSRSGFAVTRLLRIYPTYIAGFSVTIAALWASSLAYGLPFPYTLQAVLIHALPGVRDLAWSQHIDFVVWTLEVEVKFYLVCMAAAPLLRNGNPWVFAVPVGIAALCAAGRWLPEAQAVPAGAAHSWRVAWAVLLNAPMVLFMFVGVAFNYWARKVTSPAWTACLVAALFVLFVASLSDRMFGAGYTRYTISSFGVAVLLFGICAVLPDRMFSWRGFRLASAISYPLYVVHAVAGYVLMRLLVSAGLPPTACMLAAAAAAITVASAIHVAIERPTHELGRRLGRLLSQPERISLTTGAEHPQPQLLAKSDAQHLGFHSR